METLTKTEVLKKPKTKKNEINASRGWKCCKCGEEMYRGESVCTYHKCGHSKCSSCRTFQV